MTTTSSASTTSTPATPYATVADIIRKQTEIEQRITALEQSVRDTRLGVARALEELATDLGYPINDIAKTRKHIRDLAAQLREDARHG